MPVLMFGLQKGRGSLYAGYSLEDDNGHLASDVIPAWGYRVDSVRVAARLESRAVLTRWD